MNNAIMGFILLVLSSVTFLAGIIWTISWINQLALFIMRIYKDEVSEIEAKYCTIPAVYLALTFILYQLSMVFFNFSS